MSGLSRLLPAPVRLCPPLLALDRPSLPSPVFFRRQLPVYSPLSFRTVSSGSLAIWTGGGGAERRIEAWLRERYQSRAILLVDSGTSALALAMRAAAARRPGPVLLPAYACFDLVTAAMAARAEVRWYDVDPLTLQPDWRSLEAALEPAAGPPRPSALVVVHHWGIPVDMDRVRTLAEPAGALVIEDAAQAVGGSLGGRPLGGHGDLGVLSFGRGKGLTGGGGGALLARSEEAARLLAEQGRGLPPGGRGFRGQISTKVQWLLGRPWLYALPSALPFLRLGETVFHAPHPPRRMAAAQLGVLASALRLADEEADLRRRHGARLAEAAGSRAAPVIAGGVAGYLRFPLLDPALRARDLRRIGIYPGYPVALPSLEGSPYPAEAPPGARRLSAELVTLPTHRWVTEREVKELEKAVDRGR